VPADRSVSHPLFLHIVGVYNCGSTIIREEGVRSLWKGLTPFAGNLTLKYFLRFGTNAFYQNLLRDAVRFSIPNPNPKPLPEPAARRGALR